jgi:hypothetical protein
MVPLGLPRSRSSTGSSCGFHDLAPSAPTSSNLLRPSDAESSKQHAGRRLSKMRNIITSTVRRLSLFDYLNLATFFLRAYPFFFPFCFLNISVDKKSLAVSTTYFELHPDTSRCSAQSSTDNFAIHDCAAAALVWWRPQRDGDGGGGAVRKPTLEHDADEGEHLQTPQTGCDGGALPANAVGRR